MLALWIAVGTLLLLMTLGIGALSSAMHTVVVELREEVTQQQVRIAALEQRVEVLERKKQSVSGLMPVAISMLMERPGDSFEDEETRVAVAPNSDLLLVPEELERKR